MWYWVVGAIAFLLFLYVRKTSRDLNSYTGSVQMRLESHFGVEMYTKEHIKDEKTFFVLNKLLSDGMTNKNPEYQVAVACMGALICHDIRHMSMDELKKLDLNFKSVQDKIMELEIAEFVWPGTLEMFKTKVIPEILSEVKKRNLV